MCKLVLPTLSDFHPDPTDFIPGLKWHRIFDALCNLCVLEGSLDYLDSTS